MLTIRLVECTPSPLTRCSLSTTYPRRGGGLDRNVQELSCRHTVAKVLDRAPQPVLEIHRGAIAQLLARPGYRREGVAHVASARRVVLGFDVDADEIGDALPQRANTRCDAAPDVEHFAGDLTRRCVTREEICLDDVRDECEVARLLAVTEYHGSRAAERGGDEQRDNSAVLRLEVLARSENVEVAQDDGLKSVSAPEGLAVCLPSKFGRGVRRERTRQEQLMIGKRGGVPVHGRRCGVHDAARFCFVGR